MRILWIVPLLSGCAGTVLATVDSGYEAAPNQGGALHGGSLSANVGGSSIEGVGIGATVRMRAWSEGWAVPELGPHVFVMHEDDSAVAYFARLSATTGLSGIQGDIGPVFTATLEPGFIFYPGWEAVGISLTGVVAAHAAPVTPDTRLWIGARLGVAFGGIRER